MLTEFGRKSLGSRRNLSWIAGQSLDLQVMISLIDDNFSYQAVLVRERDRMDTRHQICHRFCQLPPPLPIFPELAVRTEARSEPGGKFDRMYRSVRYLSVAEKERTVGTRIEVLV